MKDFFLTSLGRLRLIAFIEGTSYLLILFVTMPLKYMMDMGTPNKYVGMLHGVFFIWYVIAVIMASYDFKWNTRTLFLALLASIIPFGTFWADAKIFSKEQVA
ncbi:MAG: DUF3817 domain-containing protein [Bernardetiaceae bacterium]|nr:DUF3817 domain-containing protein [Bernardetiaceae bacterium]